MRHAPLSVLQHQCLADAYIAPLMRATDGQGGWIGQQRRRYTQRTTGSLRNMGLILYRDDLRSALLLGLAGRRAIKVAA